MSSRSGRGKRRLHGDGSGWEEWGGYMQAKIQKLQNQFRADHPQVGSETSEIFKGVAIFVNGYTKPTSAELKKIMMQHGGVFHHYYNRSYVTHTIASNLPTSKIRQLTDQLVVKPEWITDSVKAGKLLPYQDYLLVRTKSSGQSRLKLQRSSERTLSRTVSSASSTGASCHVTNSEATHYDENVKNSLAGQDDVIRDAEMSVKDDVVSLAEENDQVIILDEMDSENLEGDNVVKASDKTISSHQGKPDEGSCDVNCAAVAPCDKNVNSVSGTEATSGENNRLSPVAKPSLDETWNTSATKTTRTPTKSNRAGEPNFVSEFYQHSRLHYLSTWGAEFRAYVNELQVKGDNTFPARKDLQKISEHRAGVPGADVSHPRGSGKPARVIMHIDMDSFFVSVGLRSRPDLKGKPVAVTHSKGKGISKDRPGTDLEYEKEHWRRKRKGQQKKGQGHAEDDLERNPDLSVMAGEFEDQDEGFQESSSKSEEESFHSMAEIASCSYEARQAGVKNGMFMGSAKKLCPDLMAIPYDFVGYREVSQQLYDTVASFTHDIEAVSCDEMLVDCTDLLADTGASPLEFASLLRQQIKDKTQCNCSAGLGSNILQAKLATRKAKPNGQFCLDPTTVEAFMQDKKVSDLPGVGWSITNRLTALGAKTCGELQLISLSTLQKEFGPKTGQSLHSSCRGQDDRPIKVEKERKTVSAEINYGIRFTMDKEVEKFLYELAEEVHNRLTKVKVKGKTITLKLKVRRPGAPKETAKFMGHGVCDNVVKSTTLPIATDDPKVIAKESCSLLKSLKLPPDDLRGIGISMSKLETPIGEGKNSGLQSILQFATARQDKADVVPLSNNEGRKKTETPKAVIKEWERKHPPSSCAPPLPKLPSLTMSPKSPKTPPAGLGPTLPTRGQSALQNSTPQTKPPADQDQYLISPSQVDMEVLKELPADIRSQIMAALPKKPPAIPSAPAEHPESTDSGSTQPGCSHWSDSSVTRPQQMTASAATGSPSASPSKDTGQVQLPPMSQLDESFMQALPPELQEEIQQAYQQQQGTAAVSPRKQQTLWLKQASPSKVSPIKSPKKSPSPRKKGPNSPVFKVPRGRGPGRKKFSPKKLNFTKQQPQINAAFNKQQDPPEVESVPEKPAEPAPEPAPEPLSFCGAVTLEEVKVLWREWMASAPAAPDEEDLDMVISYLTALFENKDLEMIYLLIKFLTRNVKKLKTESWENSLNLVVSHVQALVSSVYGCELKL